MACQVVAEVLFSFLKNWVVLFHHVSEIDQLRELDLLHEYVDDSTLLRLCQDFVEVTSAEFFPVCIGEGTLLLCLDDLVV